ncbi:MAG TPA: TadE family protein [Acidimicrobiia bacterium]|nr:TadE family protein [Acidimicrobiia bacterium]
MNRFRTNKRNDDQGAALVEFAIVLSLLVMLIFGIIEFGRAYNAQITLTHATREGVRVLAITQDGDAARAATVNAATTLDPAKLSITTGDCSPGYPTQVVASYPYFLSIPLVGERTLNLSSTAVMRCGG